MRLNRDRVALACVMIELTRKKALKIRLQRQPKLFTFISLTCPGNFVPKESRDNGSSAQTRSWYEEEPVQ